MPTNILNLPSVVIDRVDEAEHDYHIYAHALKGPSSCSACMGSEVVGFGRNEQLVKDLPIHGKRVGIYFKTRRFRCKVCSKTFLEQHTDFHPERAMTTRLVDWIGKQAIKRTFASIAEEVGIALGVTRG
jgi:transposase